MNKGNPLTYLITGVNGQDGFFSARSLLKKASNVVGVSRRCLSESTRLALLDKYPHFQLVSYPEYTSSTVSSLIAKVRPDRIIHCAGYRDIPRTEEEVAQCFHTNCDILEMLLGAIVKFAPECRLLFLSSAEIFSRHVTTPLNERSPVGPANEYGVSKARGMEIINHFRTAQNVFALSAICFNHDSCLSPSTHLVRLVPRKLLMLKLGVTRVARFYNISIRRDWSHAKDFANAFALMLEQAVPEDLVVASGIPTTLEQYINMSCEILGIEDEASVIFESRQDAHTYDRLADPGRLKTKLRWDPAYDVEMMCQEMIWWENRTYRNEALDRGVSLR